MKSPDDDSTRTPAWRLAQRLPQRQKRDHLEWLQTERFIEEVHRIEADGRSAGRTDLEARLLLAAGSVTAMRSGKFRVPTSAIELLKREFNGDFQYILLGIRDPDLSGPVRAGRDLTKRPGCHVYEHHYRSPPADLRSLAGLPTAPKEEA